MKIYMLWDMEGTSGLFTRDETWYWHPHVSKTTEEAGRTLLIADINSAVAAALDAGADEVIVCDTHHGGGNIRLDRMLADPRVTYYDNSRLTYPDGRKRWMPGLDETVDGFMVPGHHAKAGTPNAFLPHTSSLEWLDFRINNLSVGEIGLETCYAGHFGVPLVFAHGDEAGCAEAEAQFPGVVTAAVKRAITSELSGGLDPVAARALTASKVAEAVERTRTNRPAPYMPALPMTVSIRMASLAGADAAAARPGVQRLDEFTVACTVQSQAEVIKWINGTGLE